MLGKLDATVADSGDALFGHYADLGQTPKDRISCLAWQLHIPWIRAICELERPRNVVMEGRQEFIGNRAWLNRERVRPSFRRLLRIAIDPVSRNRGAYPGFLTIGDAAIARGQRGMPS